MAEKIIEKKIPAVKARPAKIVQKTIIVCDLCEKEAIFDCVMCERDICGSHFRDDYSDSGDYPDRYCEWCYVLKFRKYSKERSDMESRHYHEELDLDNKIKEESLELKK